MSLGRYLRDVFIRYFPLEMRSPRGLKIRLHNRSEISLFNDIFVRGLYPLAAFRSALDQKAPLIFDVGANNGQFSALALDEWPAAQVHAFEPQQILFDRIVQFTKTNGLETQLHANRLAISDLTGTRPFFCNHNPISASLIREKTARRTIQSVVEVPGTTLDEYAAAHGLEQIDLLKLDVEGSEIEALRGATAVLKKVRLVFIEFHPPFSQFEGGREILEAAGLTCARPVDGAVRDCVFLRGNIPAEALE